MILSFFEWLFCSLVSIDLSDSQESVIPVYFLVGNFGFLLYVGHWGFWVKYIFKYWELTFRKQAGSGLNGSTGGKKSRLFHQDLPSPWERRVGWQRGRRGCNSKSATILGMRLGDQIWTGGRRMKISSPLTCSDDLLSSLASLAGGFPENVCQSWGLDNRMNREKVRKESLHDQPEMWTEKSWRSQKVVCYRVGGWLRDWFQRRRRKRGKIDNQSICFPSWSVLHVFRECLMQLGLDKEMGGGTGKLKGKCV